MKIFKTVDELEQEENVVLSIGTFDGFHIGHRKIISTLMEEKKKAKAQSYVLTFSNHPYEILFPNKVPDKIGTIDFKIDFLKEQHLDNLILIEFNLKFANYSHIEFIDLLKKKFKKITFVLGSNFKFGKGNLGNTDYLESIQDENLKLIKVDQLLVDELRVSSTRIRNLVKNHDIELVNKLLGREFFIEGNCIEGDKLGRKIDFPTINVLNSEMAHPKKGVYKTKIEIDHQKYNSMTFIGNKTIGSNNAIQLIETHVFDFNEKVYGKKVKIYFQKWIREQIKMDSLESLKTQLERDKELIINSL